MEILNVGPLELLIILFLMFLLLGPKGMITTAQSIGSWIRKMVRSPMWREIMGYSQEIRELPQKIMDETGLKETLEEVRQSTQAAANELNTQLKEVKEAARVPEAEHLRLDTSSNAKDAVKAAGAVAVTETIADIAAAESEAGAAIVPAALAVPAGSAPEEAPADAAPAAKRRGRPRKAVEPAAGELPNELIITESAAEESVEAAAGTAAAETAPVAKRRGQPRKPVESAASSAPAELPGELNEPAPADPQPVEQPRRGRKPAAQAQPDASAVLEAQVEQESAAVKLPAAVELPAAVKLPAVSEPADEAPARRRGRPRKNTPAAPGENTSSQGDAGAEGA